MALHAVELEGIVQDITRVGNGAELHVLGVVVVVDENVFPAAGREGRVSTPTSKLTVDQLTSALQLPQRAAPGFKGATAIIAGNYDPADGRIYVRMQAPPANQGAVAFESNPSIQIEPGETVLVGPVTKNDAAGFAVNGVMIALLIDARLPAESPRSEFAFPIQLDTVPLLSPASVEGYLGDNGEFQAFIIEADGELSTDPVTTPQISIMRAEARSEGASYRLRVRGAVTTAHVIAAGRRAVVEIYRVDSTGETFLADASANIGAVRTAVRWDLDEEFITLPAPLNSPPTSIRAKFANSPNLAETVAEVEIRED